MSANSRSTMCPVVSPSAQIGSSRSTRGLKTISTAGSQEETLKCSNFNSLIFAPFVCCAIPDMKTLKSMYELREGVKKKIYEFVRWGGRSVFR